MIYIPFDNYNWKAGGPATFMKNLKSFLETSDFRYTSQIKNASGIFFPIQHDLNELKKIKNKNGFVVQRLDGIYYPSKHGESFWNFNKNIKEIYQNFTDYIVFQSQYSKKQCELIFGKAKVKNEIIYNGVDKSIFYPGQQLKQIQNQIKIITVQAFRNIDMIEPAIIALDKLKSKYDIQFSIVGPVYNKNVTPYFDREYIKRYEHKRLPEIADLLRENHIFLYSHLNPPCPNSVLEAISCGLPVVGFNSGAMSELCFFSTELLAEVSDDIIQKYEDFNSDLLADKIDYTIKNYKFYKSNALNYSHLYPFQECGKKYIEVFKNISKKSNNYRNKMNSIKTKIIKTSALFFFRRKVLKYLAKLYSYLNYERYTQFLNLLIENKLSKFSPYEKVVFLLNFENELYKKETKSAIEYNGGQHPKHEYTKYHMFFISNISNSDLVLDIGSRSGELTYDIAHTSKPKLIVGIEIEKVQHEIALKKFSAENLKFIHGDATKGLPNFKFSIITLSNVLEHIEFRVEFLRKIIKKYKPNKILIRVPCFDRDWRVPLKKDLGVDYRLDPTHFTEYTWDTFKLEMAESGLKIIAYKINWGEIWAVTIMIDQ